MSNSNRPSPGIGSGGANNLSRLRRAAQAGSMSELQLGEGIVFDRHGRLTVDYPKVKAGIAGARGPQGATGVSGADGSPGLNGTDGVDGAPGSPGINGTNGVDGAPGATGATGDTGATGATGPQGPQGPQGPPGAGALQEAAVTAPFSGDIKRDETMHLGTLTFDANWMHIHKIAFRFDWNTLTETLSGTEVGYLWLKLKFIGANNVEIPTSDSEDGPSGTGTIDTTYIYPIDPNRAVVKTISDQIVTKTRFGFWDVFIPRVFTGLVKIEARLEALNVAGMDSDDKFTVDGLFQLRANFTL